MSLRTLLFGNQRTRRDGASHPDGSPELGDEEIPGSLDLGWFWSDNKAQFQMAKIAEQDRATHFYVIGATGTGKTKFLEFLIQQDIEKGNGFGVIDPHGDLIEEIKGLLACRYFTFEDEEEVSNRVVLIGRNFEIFDPLEAIARILSLVPAKGWHTVRYFGWYSSKKRGMRKKGLHLGMKGIEPTRPRSVYRQAWAALIKKIWLEDPLVCEKCGGPMRVIAFIQDRTAIEKILRHLRLWEDPPAEAQPASRSPPEIEIVRVDEDGLSLDQTSPLPFDPILP